MVTIISEDTTWSGVMSINDVIQVAKGVTLTISEGSNITGDGYVESFGSLNIEGSEDSKVTINGLKITSLDGGNINVNYTNVIYSKYPITSFPVQSGGGRWWDLIVTNSYFQNCRIDVPGGRPGSNISGNTFNNSFIIAGSAGFQLADPTPINNNLFYGMSSTENSSIENYGSEENISISGNSFLNSGTAIRSFGRTSQHIINAENNWFNTTNKIEIDNKIEDRNDSLNYGIVNYSNFLSEPDPITPSLADSFSGSLSGTSQNDQFDGLSGVLEINGLSGIDVVNYDLSTQEITFTSKNNQIAIQDSNYRQETLYNIERINFTDKSDRKSVV